MQAIPVPVLINGTQAHWADIQLSIAGSTPIYGVTEINYSVTRKIENVYGSGSEPIGRGFGNVEYNASITLKLTEVKSLVNLAPLGDITQIPPFPISISWLDTDFALINDTLLNCQFLSNDIKTKQGDTSIDVTIPIIFAGIVKI